MTKVGSCVLTHTPSSRLFDGFLLAATSIKDLLECSMFHVSRFLLRIGRTLALTIYVESKIEFYYVTLRYGDRVKIIICQ